MITTEQKKKILAAIAQNRANYPSDAKHATSLGISTSVYSMVKQAPWTRLFLMPTGCASPVAWV